MVDTGELMHMQMQFCWAQFYNGAYILTIIASLIVEFMLFKISKDNGMSV